MLPQEETKHSDSKLSKGNQISQGNIYAYKFYKVFFNIFQNVWSIFMMSVGIFLGVFLLNIF